MDHPEKTHVLIVGTFAVRVHASKDGILDLGGRSFISSNAVVLRIEVFAVTVTALDGGQGDRRSKVGWLGHDEGKRIG